MAKDFTIASYNFLLDSLSDFGFEFQPYNVFYKGNFADRVVTLRHDVDAKKQNSLLFARIQHQRGIRGTYYFRVVKGSFDPTMMEEMHKKGHEIGYHYETMDTCKGDIDRAYDEFCRNLEVFRKIVPVSTACMHGSPLSKYDNRAIWEKYDYQSLGIIAEPYFDTDFNKVFYLTDTGRRWDGGKVSVRDKAMAGKESKNPDFTSRSYRTTFDIIEALKRNDFPSEVMLTFHPQRWTADHIEWYAEYLRQNIKNQIKRVLIAYRASSQVQKKD